MEGYIPPGTCYQEPCVINYMKWDDDVWTDVGGVCGPKSYEILTASSIDEVKKLLNDLRLN